MFWDRPSQAWYGHSQAWDGPSQTCDGFSEVENGPLGLGWSLSGSGTEPLWPMMDTARSEMGPTRSEMGLSVTRCHDFGIGSIFRSIF